MANRPTRVFTYEEVNELIPKIAGITEEIVHELDEIRRRNAADSQSSGSSISDTVLKDVESTLQEWSDRVLEMGGSPKGYFTVDFQSIDPELLYCWNYGEDRIAYIHKIWENFSHRRPLAESIYASGEHLKWIN